MFLGGIFAVRTWGVLMTTATTMSTTTVFNTATPSAMNPAATATIKHRDPSNQPQLTPVGHIQPLVTDPCDQLWSVTCINATPSPQPSPLDYWHHHVHHHQQRSQHHSTLMPGLLWNSYLTIIFHLSLFVIVWLCGQYYKRSTTWIWLHFILSLFVLVWLSLISHLLSFISYLLIFLSLAHILLEDIWTISYWLISLG